MKGCDGVLKLTISHELPLFPTSLKLTLFLRTQNYRLMSFDQSTVAASVRFLNSIIQPPINQKTINRF